MSQINKRSAYRQRVFMSQNGDVTLVYGDVPAPEGLKLLADHDVVEMITVSDHVEAAPAPAPEGSSEPTSPLLGGGGDPIPM